MSIESHRSFQYEADRLSSLASRVFTPIGNLAMKAALSCEPLGRDEPREDDPLRSKIGAPTIAFMVVAGLIWLSVIVINRL